MFTKQILVIQKSTGFVFGPYTVCDAIDALAHYALETGTARVIKADFELAHLSLESDETIEARWAQFYSVPRQADSLIADRHDAFTTDRARTEREDMMVAGGAR